MSIFFESNDSSDDDNDSVNDIISCTNDGIAPLASNILKDGGRTVSTKLKKALISLN